MIKAIAIDDEPLALDIIRHCAKDINFLKIEQYYTNALDAINYLKYNEIHLLFLDIHMPDINGIDLFKSLEVKPMVIFTTAYASYALSGFELEAIDYLLKPFSKERFKKSCLRAKEQLELKGIIGNIDSIFIKDGYELVKVNLKELYWLESEGNYLRFGLKEKEILSRMTIKDFFELCNSPYFIQVHRSYIVNLTYIDKLDKQNIEIKDKVIPIGGNYGKDILDKIRNW